FLQPCGLALFRGDLGLALAELGLARLQFVVEVGLALARRLLALDLGRALDRFDFGLRRGADLLGFGRRGLGRGAIALAAPEPRAQEDAGDEADRDGRE